MDPVSPPPLKKRPNAGLLVVIGVIVAGLAMYGYWKYIYYPSTPQYTLDRFFDAANVRDYDKVYELVEAKGPLKAFVSSAAALRNLADRFPGLIPQVESHQFGDVTVSGDHAKVHTSAVIRRQGIAATDAMDVELNRTNGIWRIDGDWVFREIVRRRAGGLLLNGQ